jgi:glycosyltransferase involved in cell wall biosynthesis
MSRILALPVHGEVKLRLEGLRTRDGHVLEWISRLQPSTSISILSRAEPWPRVTLARLRARRSDRDLAYRWRFISPQPVALPNINHPQDWWPTSTRFQPTWPVCDAALIWNPFAGRGADTASGIPILFDLLDDWTLHQAFSSIRSDVEVAYQHMFERATAVSANSEGTLALAHRFGRTDAKLIRNGCDPGRFDSLVQQHDTFTLGYGGKIGHRLDLDLITAVSAAFPKWRLEFVGPILMKDTAQALRALPNVVLLGDTHYADYPSRLQRWDVAWVPHRTGSGEVGGDVIKLYEYRAAGLPVVSTRIIGWERALDGVAAVDPGDVGDALARIPGAGHAMQVARDDYKTPPEHTWRSKTIEMLDLLGLNE